MKPVFFGLLLILESSELRAGALPDKYQRWLNQEVAYIISARERAEFSKLATDPERDIFIEKFWKIRDTDTSTQESEFKSEHYSRIQYANERFADGWPGWKSARGRIWILHGPPDDIHYEYGGGTLGIDIENPTAVLTGNSNADRRRNYRLTFNRPETEIWVYRQIEGARNFPSYFQVLFSRTDPARLYELNQVLRHLSSRGNLNYQERVQRDFAIMTFLKGHFFGGRYQILYAGEYKFQDLDDFYQSIFHPRRLPSIAMHDFQNGIQDLERSTGEVLMEKLALGRALKEKVRSRVFFEELPLAVRIGTLKTASTSTLLAVTIVLSDGELQNPIKGKQTLSLYLELVKDGGEVAASLVDSVSFERSAPALPERTTSLYQTRLAAAPGRYRLGVYAALAPRGASTSQNVAVSLPDYGNGSLSVSDVLLFDRVLPKADYRAGKYVNEVPRFLGRSHPIFLKDFVLIPSLDARFRRRQALTTFFEVYNPGIAARENTPALQLRCRLKNADGLLRELPRKLLDYVTESDKRKTVYGISIPLISFATGQYEVMFDVYDPIQNKSVSTEASFTIY